MKIKIVSLLLIVTLFITMFATSCFADFEFTYNDVNYTFPDYPEAINNYSYFYMADNSSTNSDGSVRSNYVFYCSNSPFVVGQSYTGQCFSYFDDEWHSGSANQGFVFSSSSLSNVIYSNENITDNSGNVVFQKASQPVQGTLAKIVEKQETNKVMEEILGILPVIIVVLVGLIAIRKAIAFLQALLHRS